MHRFRVATKLTKAIADVDTTGADTSFCKVTWTVVGVCPSFSTPPQKKKHLKLIGNLASAAQTHQVQAAKYPEDENRASTENCVLMTVVNMLTMIASQEKLWIALTRDRTILGHKSRIKVYKHMHHAQYCTSNWSHWWHHSLTLSPTSLGTPVVTSRRDPHPAKRQIPNEVTQAGTKDFPSMHLWVLSNFKGHVKDGKPCIFKCIHGHPTRSWISPPSSPPSHEHLRAACQRHGFQDGSEASAHGPPQHLPWARHPTHSKLSSATRLPGTNTNGLILTIWHMLHIHATIHTYFVTMGGPFRHWPVLQEWPSTKSTILRLKSHCGAYRAILCVQHALLKHSGSPSQLPHVCYRVLCKSCTLRPTSQKKLQAMSA